jgi:tetratricopeptide (TPR) repeat protein
MGEADEGPRGILLAPSRSQLKMTEPQDRPSPAAVLVLLFLGVGVFVLPQVFRQAGFLDFVDGSLRSGDVWATPGIGPLAALSFALDHELAAGTEVAGVMHLHSALLHVLAAIALLVLLVRRGLPSHRALAGAALFLVHPAMLETAVVIAFRPAILAALFAILAADFALRRMRGGGRWAGLAAFLLASAAVLSSPFAVVTPVFAWFLGVRAVPGRWALTALTAGASVGFCVTAVVAGGWPFTQFDPTSALDPLFALAWPRTGAMVLDSVLDSVFGAVVGSGPVAATLAFATLVVLLIFAARLRRAWPGIAAGAGILALGCVVAGATPRLAPDLGGGLAVIGLAVLFASMPLPRRVTVIAAAAAVLVGGSLDITLAARYQNSGTLLAGLTEQSHQAATLYAKGLAASPLDAQRRLARGHLERVVANSTDDAQRMVALELLVDVASRLGDAIAASQSAESLCVLGERLGVPAERMVALYLRAAECFSVENSRQKVDEYFGKARNLAPTHAAVVAADAEQLYVAFVHAVRRETGNPDVNVTPGWARDTDPRLVPIEAKIREAIDKDPDCYRALILRGRIAEATGAVLSAVPLYERAIEAGPKRAEARILLAKLYVTNDLAPAAEACVKKALHDGIDDPALHYLLGSIYAVQGRRDDARRYLEAYLVNRPGNRDAMVILANVISAEAMSQMDRIPVAELAKYAERIRQLNSEDPKGWMVRAAVLCKAKPRRFIEAIVLLEKAERRMPDNPDVKRQLACAHRDYGWTLTLQQRDSAMDHFKTFLELAPRGVRTEAVRNAIRSHCKALERSGRERLRAGEAAIAEASFGRSAFLSPRRPGAFFQLGLALMNQEKLEASLEAFEEAVRLGRLQKQDVSPFMLPLLDILQKTGRSDEAKKRGAAFLADPGDADEVTLQRIRAMLR